MSDLNINIVTSYNTTEVLCNYSGFTKMLGATVSNRFNTKSDSRFNNSDKFAIDYNVFYKAVLQKRGFIGSINIYYDHMITDKSIVFYINNYEYVHIFDFDECNKMGIGNYLGKLLHMSETMYREETKDIIIDTFNVSKKGDIDKIKKSPGSIRFEDIEEFLGKRRK